MKTALLPLSLTVLSITAGCTQQSPGYASIPPIPPLRATFDGIPIPGSALDAVDAGFTDCRGDTDVVQCARRDSKLMGVALDQISLVLFNGNTFSDRKTLAGKRMEDLHYDMLTLDFAAPVGAPDCMDASTAPAACAPPGTKLHFVRMLDRQGWVPVEMNSAKFSGTHLVHPLGSVVVQVPKDAGSNFVSLMVPPKDDLAWLHERARAFGNAHQIARQMSASTYPHVASAGDAAARIPTAN